MSFLNELAIYQEKALRTASLIVELERTAAETIDAHRSEYLKEQIEMQRAVLRMFDSMVTFLNCCIELQGSNVAEAKIEKAKKA